MRPVCFLFALLAISRVSAADSIEQVRNDIIAAMQHSIDALARGDIDAAVQMDTDDWVSITLNDKPIPKKQLVDLMHRDRGEVVPPGWRVVWKPDYAHVGTLTGIQIYDLQLAGDKATVLYLIGGMNPQTIDGVTHQVWRGSHIRDSWVRTPSGWRRSKHEKLTVNEQMVDGKPVDRGLK